MAKSIFNRINAFFYLIFQLFITWIILMVLLSLTPAAAILLPTGILGYFTFFIMTLFIRNLTSLMARSKGLVKGSFGSQGGSLSFLFK